MNKADEDSDGLRKQGVVVAVVSVVFLLLSGLLWHVGGAIALGTAIILLAWGLHGVLRSVVFLWRSRELEDDK